MRFVAGVLAGLLILPLGAWLYLRFGYAPVATAASPLPFEKKITHMALEARIRSESPKSSPVPVNDANLLDGVRTYRQYCAVCHGLPDQRDTATANGMFPKPPQLFKHRVIDDPVGETYWKVENGIRLTGMPAYKGSVSEDDIWKVTLMLAHADKLTPEAVALLKQPVPAE